MLFKVYCHECKGHPKQYIATNVSMKVKLKLKDHNTLININVCFKNNIHVI